MPRVSALRIQKAVARETIKFAKRVDVTMNYWHPSATSAFEFHRQMSSRHLKKVNPDFECHLHLHENEDPPVVSAEYANGAKWSTPSAELKLEELREQFYAIPMELQEIAEDEDEPTEEFIDYGEDTAFLEKLMAAVETTKSKKILWRNGTYEMPTSPTHEIIIGDEDLIVDIEKFEEENKYIKEDVATVGPSR